MTIANTGDAHLRIDELRIRGTGGTRFAIEGENCTGDSLLVGEGCAVSVVFTPNQPGPVGATLRVTGNAPGSPHNVALSGTGGAPACAGTTATIVGSAGADTLVGTPGTDVVALLGGDDTFRGDTGGDSVCGGGGDDDLNGQAAADTLRGGSGDDQLRGDTGSNDTLYGGSDDDDLFGGTGIGDACNGSSGTDTADVACETVTGSRRTRNPAQVGGGPDSSRIVVVRRPPMPSPPHPPAIWTPSFL